MSEIEEIESYKRGEEEPETAAVRIQLRLASLRKSEVIRPPSIYVPTWT